MARILSGADFGVQFPQNGGVANNRFGLSMAAQLLGGQLNRQSQEVIASRDLAVKQQKADQSAEVKMQEKRLGALSVALTGVKNMPSSTPKERSAKNAAFARIAIKEQQEGRDSSPFMPALNASSGDEMNMFIDGLIGQSEAYRGEASEWMKANSQAAGFEAVTDAEGNIIAQRNIETGEVTADPRASKLFSEEEMAQKLSLIQERAKATVAEQQGTPQAGATLELTKARLEELQQNNKLKEVKIEEEKLKNVEDRNDANEVKQIRFNEASGVINQIDALLEGRNFEHAFGKAVTATPELLRSQRSIDAIANVDQIRALLSLESRQKLKGSGTISDNEQKTLEKSATVLANPLISEELAEEELIKVKRIFEDSARRNRVTQAAPAQPQEIPEGATATNPTTGEKIIYRGGQWEAQ